MENKKMENDILAPVSGVIDFLARLGLVGRASETDLRYRVGLIGSITRSRNTRQLCRGYAILLSNAIDVGHIGRAAAARDHVPARSAGRRRR